MNVLVNRPKLGSNSLGLAAASEQALALLGGSATAPVEKTAIIAAMINATVTNTMMRLIISLTSFPSLLGSSLMSCSVLRRTMALPVA
jgi:hypothetical protein